MASPKDLPPLIKALNEAAIDYIQKHSNFELENLRDSPGYLLAFNSIVFYDYILKVYLKNNDPLYKAFCMVKIKNRYKMAIVFSHYFNFILNLDDIVI